MNRATRLALWLSAWIVIGIAFRVVWPWAMEVADTRFWLYVGRGSVFAVCLWLGEKLLDQARE